MSVSRAFHQCVNAAGGGVRPWTHCCVSYAHNAKGLPFHSGWYCKYPSSNDICYYPMLFNLVFSFGLIQSACNIQIKESVARHSISASALADRHSWIVGTFSLSSSCKQPSSFFFFSVECLYSSGWCWWMVLFTHGLNGKLARWSPFIWSDLIRDRSSAVMSRCI